MQCAKTPLSTPLTPPNNALHSTITWCPCCLTSCSAFLSSSSSTRLPCRITSRLRVALGGRAWGGCVSASTPPAWPDEEGHWLAVCGAAGAGGGGENSCCFGGACAWMLVAHACGVRRVGVRAREINTPQSSPITAAASGVSQARAFRSHTSGRVATGGIQRQLAALMGECWWWWCWCWWCCWCWCEDEEHDEWRGGSFCSRRLPRLRLTLLPLNKTQQNLQTSPITRSTSGMCLMGGASQVWACFYPQSTHTRSITALAARAHTGCSHSCLAAAATPQPNPTDR